MSSIETSTTKTPDYLGMAWYKFLTSYGLIAGAVLNFLCSFVYLSGSIYSSETNGEVTAEQVYAYYGEALHFVDVMYGLLIIVLAILAVVLRHKLANFDPDAMIYVYIYYFLSIGAPVVHLILTAVITEQSIIDDLNIGLLVSLVVAFVHIRYFKQRAYLFVGKTETSDDLVQELPSVSEISHSSVKTINTTETIPDDVVFCRNCGAKLMDDSMFCHRCGKKIR